MRKILAIVSRKYAKFFISSYCGLYDLGYLRIQILHAKCLSKNILA